ncbi:MAG: UbiA-like polyprenyltransferase [Bacteroidota bacterium]
MSSFFNKTSKYFSFIKISHTLFSVPFALIGFFLGTSEANNRPDILLLLLVLLCVLFARNAAMGFNRYADRVFDKKNPRTSNREIPQNHIKPWSALVFIIVNAVLFIGTSWFINVLCFALSPIALIVILGYSYTKRFTSLAHYILGLGLSLAPIGAYLAVTGRFALVPVLYSVVVFFWVSGFDVIYSLQDEEFDRAENLKSIPSFFGRKKALTISSVTHVICGLCVCVAGVYSDTGVFFWIGALLFIGLLVYQHRIVKPLDISRVNIAFATTNGFAGIIFAAFVITDICFKVPIWNFLF